MTVFAIIPVIQTMIPIMVCTHCLAPWHQSTTLLSICWWSSRNDSTSHSGEEVYLWRQQDFIKICCIMTPCSTAVVPNPQAVDRYWSVGHLVPGLTERINNLHYFRFIYYLSLNHVLFWKMTRFSPLHPSMIYSWRMSRRLSRSRDTLPLKIKATS